MLSEDTLNGAPRRGQAPWRGVGFLTPAGGLFLGSGSETSLHTSHAYKICIAAHGEFFLSDSARAAPVRCAAAVIPPDRPHLIDARGAMLALFYLVPEQAAGQRLSAALRGKGIFAPQQSLVARLAPRLRRYLTAGASPEEASETCEYLFNNLAPEACLARSLDGRVQAALDYLDATLSTRVTIAEVARAVALSPSRLEHLFREVVGIPIKRYLLWHRVRRAVELMPDHYKLSDLAQTAGFADSPHLSRAFRRMLGVPPSSLSQHIRLLKT